MSSAAAVLTRPPAAFASPSKDEFAAAQMQMTQTWYDNLLRSGRNVEHYVAQRQALYLERWREAGRYIGADRRVLDVGGGNLFDDLFSYFRAMRWDYWFADVGEGEVRNAAALAAKHGYDPAHCSRRLNHELNYDEASFDAVFSSHCIEHSMDLALTLRQLNRILKIGGDLVVSIPFGWDEQTNHPYFFSVGEWLSLIEDAGFRVRAHQIGGEYPEIGEDLMIAARKVGPVADRLRLDIAAHVKSNYRFQDYRNPALRYVGLTHDRSDRLILDGANWKVEMRLDAGTTEALPVFSRHHWSGIVCVRSGADSVQTDLFRTQPVNEPVRLSLSVPAAPGQILEIVPVGRNEMSAARQAVLFGVMTR